MREPRVRWHQGQLLFVEGNRRGAVFTVLPPFGA